MNYEACDDVDWSADDEGLNAAASDESYDERDFERSNARRFSRKIDALVATVARVAQTPLHLLASLSFLDESAVVGAAEGLKWGGWSFGAQPAAAAAITSVVNALRGVELESFVVSSSMSDLEAIRKESIFGDASGADVVADPSDFEGRLSIALVPIRPRSRGERRSLRTFLLPGVHVQYLSAHRPSLFSIPTHLPRRLSTPLLTSFERFRRARRERRRGRRRGGVRRRGRRGGRGDVRGDRDRSGRRRRRRRRLGR